MRIILAGYRDWALSSFQLIAREFVDIEFTIVKTPEELAKFKNSIILGAGWSWIIDEKFLNDNEFVALIHPSDLPDYAGGTPIQHQIIDGAIDTKCTLFKVTPELDNGPVIDKCLLNLSGNMKDILARLTEASVILFRNFLSKYPNIIEIPQPNGRMFKKRRRTSQMSEINISDFHDYTARELYNKIRALQDPYPNAYIVCKNNTKLYITESKT